MEAEKRYFDEARSYATKNNDLTRLQNSKWSKSMMTTDDVSIQAVGRATMLD